MADTDCPVCGTTGRLATNHLLTLYRCTNRSCRQEYEVNHTTCAYPSCAAWVDNKESGLCHYHAAQIGIHPDGEPYRPDAAKADDEREPPPTCSKPGCIALSDHDGRCWEHPLPQEPPDPPEERELPMCAHRGCLNEPDTDGLCWSHYERREHPDRRPDPFRDRD
jgi:hypothetical protein